MSLDGRPFGYEKVIKCDCKAEMPSDHIFIFWRILKMEKNERITEDCKKAENLNNDTELVFIIDRSGSMSGLEADTIGGFNSMIAKQRSEGEGTVYVTTVLFNSHSEMIHDREPIHKIEPMNERTYFVGGCTALYDAIGDTIQHIASMHRYLRREDVPAHTIFVITTDGYENASRTFERIKVKDMIKYRTEKFGWEFIFVAANIDAVETAAHIGIREQRAANYVHSSRGIKDCYDAMNDFVCMSRSCSIAPSDVSWKKKLEKNDADKVKDKQQK